MKILVNLEKVSSAMNVVNLKKIALAVLSGFFFFEPRFRTWVRDQTTTYIIALATALIIATPLLLIGILVPDRTVSSLALLFVIIIFLLSWIPAGLINAALNPASNDIFPVTIRRIAGWLAFLGWLGVIHNDWLTYWFVIIGIFLFFIFAAFRPGKNSDGLVVTFVAIMTIWTIWVWAEPDSNRAFNRFVGSYVGLTVTGADRQSLRNEASSKATYARLLKNVKVAYEAELNDEDVITEMRDVSISLDQDDMFLIVSQKKKAYPFDGQSFVQIKVPKSNGSFIGGYKIWIDADLVMIGSRTDIDRGLSHVSQNNRNLAPIQKQNSRTSSTSYSSDGRNMVLSPGVHTFRVKAGERTPMFSFPDCGYYPYSISSPSYNYDIVYSANEKYHGDPNLSIPTKTNPSFFIVPEETEIITITVSKA